MQKFLEQKAISQELRDRAALVPSKFLKNNCTVCTYPNIMYYTVYYSATKTMMTIWMAWKMNEYAIKWKKACVYTLCITTANQYRAIPVSFDALSFIKTEQT